MSQNASLMARRGMLVGTRAVVLPSTLHSSAEGPETQQVFGGSGPSSFLGDPRRVLLWVLLGLL